MQQRTGDVEPPNSESGLRLQGRTATFLTIHTYTEAAVMLVWDTIGHDSQLWHNARRAISCIAPMRPQASNGHVCPCTPAFPLSRIGGGAYSSSGQEVGAFAPTLFSFPSSVLAD